MCLLFGIDKDSILKGIHELETVDHPQPEVGAEEGLLEVKAGKDIKRAIKH
ncbi:MAG: hypothetical protein ACLFVP_04555 [Candidatus Bathyarchaeia archaeon]